MACSVCKHEAREEIEWELATGAELKSLARKYNLKATSLSYHRKVHVRRTLAKAAERIQALRATDLVRRLRDLTTRAERIARKAESAEQFSAAIAGVHEMSRHVELIAKLTGLLDESARVNVLVQEREARENDQLMQLERLTLEERIELRRLLAKVQGGAIEIEPRALISANGRESEDADQ